MKQLIINADDFGLSAGVSKGIVEAGKQGGITSTTAMMCVPSGIENIGNNMESLTVPCGVHLQLTGHNSTPLTADILDACVETNGYFPRNPHKVKFKPSHVKAEWKAQIEKFIALFGKPSHLDSHHEFHTLPAYKQIALELSQKFNLPMRGDIPVLKNWSTTGKPVTFLTSAITQMFKQTNRLELMAHPGFSDDYLQKISSMNTMREQELEILCSPKFQEFLRSENINLISYLDL